MALTAEQQALFDHARRALPRWLTRGKSAVLEWLHAYTHLFDSARVQGQDWLDITYLDTAAGAELDQHALDRGTTRRAGEDDATLRERLRNITDVVTEPALKDSVDALLAASGLGESAWVTLRRDKGFCQFPYNDLPATASAMNTALGGYGAWSAGYLCNELSGNLNAAFGAPASLTPSGSPTYGIAGPQGIERKKGIQLDTITDQFSGGDVFDLDATTDLALFWVGKFSSVPSAYANIFSRVGAGFSNGWAVFHTSTPVLGIGAGPGGSYAATVPSAGFLVNRWHVAGAVIDRTTNTMRFAIMAIDDGTIYISAQIPIAGSFSVASTFRVGNSPWIPGPVNFQCAGFYVAHGVGAATGISANLNTVLSNFRNYLFPRDSSAFLSRGYRMTFPQRPMEYIVILPYGTTSAMGEAVAEYLRQYGPAGYGYIVEIRANP